MPRKRHGPLAPAAALALAVLAGATQPETVEVELWANDDKVDTLPNVVRSGSHPCGATALVRLSRMPPHLEQEGPLGTELVAEAGPSGARWSVPVGYDPLAIDGGALLVALPGQRLWIDTGGNIRRDRSARRYADPRRRDCPAPAAHPNSAYAVCAEFRDLGTGRPRLIQYEAPCT